MERILRRFPVLVTDVDGTLLNTRGELTPPTRKVLARYLDLGGHIILATGKLFGSIAHLCQTLSLRDTQITGNGAVLVCPSTGTREAIGLLDPNEREQIEVALTTHHIPFVLYGVSQIFHRDDSVNSRYLDILRRRSETYIYPLKKGSVFDPAEVIKILCFVDARSGLEEELHRAVSPFCRLTRIIRTDPRFVEFVPVGVSKMEGLRRILSELKMSAQSALGFGDSENDVELLTGVGLGVVMANALLKIRRIATHVTKSNNEDGLAHFMENAVLEDAKVDT
jgi:hypothetical protein